MNVTEININNYRNIDNINIEPCNGVNIIFGENAQGKTNLLESIWLFSGFKSFRGTKETDLIKFGEEYLKTGMNFYGQGRNQKAAIIINRQKKRIILNSVPITTASGLIGHFNCVVFSPAYISVVRGNPSERRKFIDTALCQTKPQYSKILNEYKKIVDQRNSLLKDIKYKNKNYELLEIWNDKLSETAAIIINERREYVNKVGERSQEIYNGLTRKREKLEIYYNMKISPHKYKISEDKVTKEEILNLLKRCEAGDIIAGSTEIGAHRDDIEIKIDGQSAKIFASQGQQRSAALSLKLGEAEILKKITDENPVILLDDVMSELDINRQNYILNHIKEKQVFITCCDPSTVLRLCDGKTFNIKNGKIKR